MRRGMSPGDACGVPVGRMISIAVSFLIVIVIAASCGTSAPSGTGVEGGWGFKELRVDGTSIEIPSDVRSRSLESVALWVRFESGELWGEGPCNAFSGGYELGDGIVTMTNVVSNAIACERGGQLENLILSQFAGMPLEVQFPTPQTMELTGGDVHTIFERTSDSSLNR